MCIAAKAQDYMRMGEDPTYANLMTPPRTRTKTHTQSPPLSPELLERRAKREAMRRVPVWARTTTAKSAKERQCRHTVSLLPTDSRSISPKSPSSQAGFIEPEPEFRSIPAFEEESKVEFTRLEVETKLAPVVKEIDAVQPSEEDTLPTNTSTHHDLSSPTKILPIVEDGEGGQESESKEGSHASREDTSFASSCKALMGELRALLKCAALVNDVSLTAMAKAFSVRVREVKNGARHNLRSCLRQAKETAQKAIKKVTFAEQDEIKLIPARKTFLQRSRSTLLRAFMKRKHRFQAACGMPQARPTWSSTW